VKGSKFLVKNFTDGDIKVAFDSEDETGILIPGNAAQVCIIGESSGYGLYVRDTVYVTAEASSEKGVEVQCLRW
jgi:trans-2-enoyl-CoA reductase